MSCITAILTCRCGNRINKFMLKSRNGFAVGIFTVTRISLATCYAACRCNLVRKGEGVTCRGNSYAIRVIAYRTCINVTSVNCTSSRVSGLNVIVTGSNGNNLCYYVTATNTYTCLVLICSTGAGCCSPLVIMTPRRASFSGSESCNCICREVICLKGNVAVSVGCLDRLYLTVICNEPDNYTVYVLAGSECIRNGNGNHTVELGNRSISLHNGEVIYGAVTDLLNLIGCKAACNVAYAKLFSRYVDVLACKSTASANLTTEVDVSVLKCNLTGNCKFILGYVCISLIGSINYRLGSRAVLTRVGSDAVYKTAFIPSVTVVYGNNILDTIIVTILTRCNLHTGG